MKWITFAAIAGALATLNASHAADFSAGIGAEYTTGKYGGTESTDMLYVPFGVKLESGAWVFKASIPYIHLSGPANVVGAGGDVIALPDANAGRRTESGPGDIVTSAFVNLLDERNAGFGMDVGAKVKLGTADETKGLGTGENDWSLQADFFKPLGALTAFATLGYRWYGDPPGIELRDVPYGALGATYKLSGGSSVGAAYDYRPHISPGGAAVSEASLFWSVRPSPQWKLQIYGIVGFDDASPDAGVGALLEHRF